jgi:hypothetical protein
MRTQRKWILSSTYKTHLSLPSPILNNNIHKIIANFCDSRDCEMKRAHVHFHPRKSFEPSPRYTTDNSSQCPSILHGGRPIHQGSSDDTVIFAMEGQHPLLPPQGSFEPHASHVSGSLIPCGFTPPQDWPLSQPGYIHFQAKNNLLVNDLAQSQQQSSQSLTRKRAPKAQTMSAKSWRPCEGRLKQLYVHDGKSIRELRETVNKEFGFTAT